MSKKEIKHQNAKQKAYEEKQEKQGRKVVAWIFGALLALAIFYVIFTISLVN